jgi:hypothetical protein
VPPSTGASAAKTISSEQERHRSRHAEWTGLKRRIERRLLPFAPLRDLSAAFSIHEGQQFRVVE